MNNSNQTKVLLANEIEEKLENSKNQITGLTLLVGIATSEDPNSFQKFPSHKDYENRINSIMKDIEAYETAIDYACL